MFSKKPLIVIVIILAVVLVIVAYFWFGGYLKPQAETEKKIEETVVVSEQKSVVETEIEATKKQLEELSKLTSEEKQKREEELQILSQQKVSQDVSVEGVKVILGGNKKIIRNTAQGYSMEVPLSLVVARSVASDWLELHDSEFMCEGDPECNPIMRIRVINAGAIVSDLEKWFREEEKKARAPIYTPREKLAIGGETVYRVTEIIPAKFEGYYYYWAKDKKIYYVRISKFDEEEYKPYIETFKVE